MAAQNDGRTNNNRWQHQNGDLNCAFEFWLETTWLSGSQMAQTPKELKSGSALSWVDQSVIFHFHTGFYVYDQLWKVVDLEYQQFRAKKTDLLSKAHILIWTHFEKNFVTS